MAALLGALLAAASPAAAAPPQLTRGATAYQLVMADGADSLRTLGRSGPPPKNALLQLIPSGADAAPWSVGPKNCAQDQRSYSVSCTGDSAPLTIQAGGGADLIDGSASPVALNIDGGPGQDYLTGSAFDDSFTVRDGEVDIVDCGAGQDTVVADPDDALYGCERVDLPPPPPPPPAPQPAPVPPLVSPAPGPALPSPASTVALRIPGVIAYRLTTTPASARFSRLTVRGLPAGARVQVRCRGRGCPRRRLEARGTDATFSAALRRVRLRRGAVLEVRLTAPGFVGRVVRFTVGRNRVRSATLCLAPDARTPGRC